MQCAEVYCFKPIFKEIGTGAEYTRTHLTVMTVPCLINSNLLNSTEIQANLKVQAGDKSKFDLLHRQ